MAPLKIYWYKTLIINLLYGSFSSCHPDENRKNPLNDEFRGFCFFIGISLGKRISDQAEKLGGLF